MKALSWIMVAAIPVIAVSGATTSQNVLAVIMLILVLLASISFIARRIITKIDIAERTIRMTWKVGALAWHRVYSLGDYATAEMQVKGDSRGIVDKIAGDELLIGIVGTRLESRRVDYKPFLDDEYFNTALRNAGLRQVSFHSLRHSNASMRIQAGQNIKYIQTQMGQHHPGYLWTPVQRC